MSWDLSCTDWVERLKSGRSLVPELPLNITEGDRAVAVFNKLRLADVPGTPLLADAGGDWFRDIVRALFGSLDPYTRARVIRELFLLVPKKNSKTTYGALLMLTALLLNFRPRATFILTAPVQDSADTAFQAAAGAIALDPVLDKMLHVREHLKVIVHRETKATLEIMTFDPSVLTGQKVSGGVLIDELHVVAKMAKAPSAIRQLRGGMIPFPEAFLAFITTQSEESPVGPFRAELMKARAIRDGRQRGAMLPVLYEFPEEMQRDPAQWRNPANWHMVTPNAGRSITIPRLQEEFETAEATSVEELRAWASQHLDVQIGLALRSDSWAGAAFWESSVDRTLTLATLLQRSEVAVVGIDGGGLDDLLGLAVLGRERGTRRWLLWTKAWAHKIVFERRKEIETQLNDLQEAGELSIVEKMETAVKELADIVCEVRDAGLLPEKAGIGVDRAGSKAAVEELESAERGFGQATGLIVAIPQGYQLMGTIKDTEVALADGDMVHADQALMDWCVSNAKVVPKDNAVLITKQASGTAKIDPLMATFDAVWLMSMNPEANVIGEDYELVVA